MYFDYTYIYLIIPALILSMYAQFKIQSTFSKYQKVRNKNDLSAYDVARNLLDDAGLEEIPIEGIQGNLTDHYDPQAKVLRLSSSVYNSHSVAALGVAAHEVGHAIQHAVGYSPLGIRNLIFPVANIGSNMAIPLFLIGLLFGSGLLMNLGILFFALAFLFHLVTLPVEFNASNRAIYLLEEGGYLVGDDLNGAKKVLSAAAMTYVAAAVMALAQLLRLVALSRRND